MSFSDGLALGGLGFTVLLVYLDKAGRLKGPALLILLGLAICMFLPLVLGIDWVSKTHGMARFSRSFLMVCMLGAAYSLLAIWASPSGIEPDEIILRSVNRNEFLQDCNRELTWLTILVTLNREYSPTELGHFRVLVKFMPESWVRRPGQPFWLAIRDGYMAWADKVVRNVGVEQLAGVAEDKPLVDYKQLFQTNEKVSAIQLGGAVPSSLW